MLKGLYIIYKCNWNNIQKTCYGWICRDQFIVQYFLPQLYLHYSQWNFFCSSIIIILCDILIIPYILYHLNPLDLEEDIFLI